jgi:protein-S-isoprenylcysteine O-methyltransferase Ste14
MDRGKLAAMLYALSGLAAVVISIVAEPRLALPRSVAKPAGMLVFALGMALFAWAVVHLREVFLGTVEPVSERLVTGGPYRWVRHPLYLSMLVMASGLALALRSQWGLACVVLLFAPTGVWRARLEEKALSAKFGQQWVDYASRTRFLLPMLW